MDNKILLLNAAIMTANGTFKLSNISLDEVKEMLTEENIMSAIGHNATADIMTELVGINIPANRIQAKQEPKQKAIIFKLLKRPEEGKILNREEIEEIGYEFLLLERLE